MRTALRRSLIIGVLALLLVPLEAFAAVGTDPETEGSASPNGYVRDAVLVKFANDFPAAAERAAFGRAHGLAEVSFTPLSHWFRFRVTDGKTPNEHAKALGGDRAVASAVKIALGQRSYTPTDNLYSEQWYLPKTRMNQAWDLAAGGATSYIALVDSGVQNADAYLGNHPDLGVIAGKNFMNGSSNVNDTYGHGTMVAGIMAAFTGNVNGNLGIAGINYAAPILVAKDGDEVPAIDLTAAGIEYAVQRSASAINVSTAYTGTTSAERQPLKDAVTLAWNAGRPVVASAGNGNQSIVGYYPAAFTNVITVGGTEQTDHRASFANYGDASVPIYIDLAAPAVDMCTTKISSIYYCNPGPSGTSFSAPMVTGVIGLMKKRYPSIGSIAIRNRLQAAADKVGGYSYTGSLCSGGTGISVQLGCGRLDAYDAIR